MATKKKPTKKAPTKKKATKKAPSKKPAPKKKPPRKKKRPVGIQLAEKLDIQTSVPEPEDASRDFLRFTAETVYTTDLNGMTVAQLASHPMFAAIPHSTLEKWSIKDKWGEKRRVILERWKTQIEARVGDELIQYRMKAIAKMAKIRDHLFKKLIPFDHEYEDSEKPIFLRDGGFWTPCKVCGNPELSHVDPFLGVTGDKAVKALLDLMEMELKLSELVLAVTTTPGYGQGAAAGLVRGNAAMIPVKPELSQDEVRRAAMAVLKKRREDMRGTT